MRRATWIGALCSGAAVVLGASIAGAQTWSSGQGPALDELFAIDKTGESGWLYGEEDLAGDGLGSFKQQEMSIDIRTAYASTNTARFWFRVYVSDTQSPGGNVAAYVFIDSDLSAATGGKADASNVDPKFTSDSSPGGYEYIFGVRGNATVLGVWEWQKQQNQWAPKQTQPAQVAAESGVFLDPIRVNEDNHGYLQGAVDLAVVGLTQACQANLYVRTSNETASLGVGDLEVGQIGSCVPKDANNNGVPDPIENNAGCTSDAQCPNGGVCVNGDCVFAKPCSGDADCAATESCIDSRCVAKPTGTTCTDNTPCGDLVCVSGQCTACSVGSTECGSGRVCGPDGRCVTGTPGGGGTSGGGDGGIALEPGEEIQGGACACSTPSGRRSALAWLLLSLPLLSLRRRRRAASAR